MVRLSTWVTASAVALLSCGATKAANLLTNGGFDGSIAGWTVLHSGSSAFGSYDATAGYGSPGAALIDLYLPNGDVQLKQCVDIVAQNVDFVFYSKVKSSGGGPNTLGIGTVDFYSTTGCDSAGYLTRVQVTDIQTTASGWKRQTLLNYPAPAGTQSAYVNMENSSSGPNDRSASVDFDDAGFGPAGTFYTPPVTSNLLANPDFQFDLLGWHPTPSTASWDNGSGYGGSTGQLSLQALNTGDTASVYQCVNIDAQAIELEAFSRIDYTGGDPDTSELGLTSYSAPGCSGYIADTSAPIISIDNSGWSHHALHNYSLPAGTKSVTVDFSLNPLTPTNTSIGLFVDHIGFGATGVFVSDVVFQNGFE